MIKTSRIENVLNKNRLNNRRNLVTYLNSGDPTLAITASLIRQCHENGVDLIELGVPFPNSFTDGKTVINSHKRALKNKVTFEDVIEMVKYLRTDCQVPIVLLADFSHTVKPRGIEYIVKQCADAGIDGILLHGLPPLYITDYLQQTKAYNIDPIFSLYPNSSKEMIDKVVNISSGFIYLVSQYGRTGGIIDFTSKQLNQFYTSVRQATSIPLMAGFGIKGLNDMNTIFTHSQVDGVIMGSAICHIIESSESDLIEIQDKVKRYLNSINVAKNIGYPDSDVKRNQHELTS